MGVETTTLSETRTAVPVDSRTVFIRCVLLSLSVIVLAMLAYVAIAIVVNPRQQLFSPFHTFPAATLNSRSIKLEFFRKYNAVAPVRGLIMGSSSSLRMSPEQLQQITEKRFFNAGVFVGTPRDYLAQYRLLKVERVQLSVLVIGIDAAEFRKAPEYNELKANWPMQTALDPRHTGRLSKLVHWMGVYKDTFSAAYADDVHRSIWAYLNRIPPAMVFEPDGRINYLGWDRNVADHPDRDPAISACSDLDIGLLSTPVILSSTQQRAIEELIREARGDNVDVRIWIPPYHPEFFARLAKSPEAAGNLDQVRNYVNGLQERFGISVFDLSHESSFGGDPDNWYDCSHFRDANAHLVANKVMGDASNSAVQAIAEEK
jgi:hypothetical protein